MRFLHNTLMAIGLCLIVSMAGASPSAPQNGVDYKTLENAQPTNAGKKVEVIEFFSYACPHCNAFDPALTEWVKKQGDHIVFKRVPVNFHESWVPLQRLYYTLEAMGKLEELHHKIFQAIHEQHQELDSDASITEFVVKQGIDKAKFLSFYNSFGIQAKVGNTLQLQDDYKIDSVPQVVIDGRYVAEPQLAGSGLANAPESALHAAMLQVMDWLVAKVRNEKGLAETVQPRAKKYVKK